MRKREQHEAEDVLQPPYPCLCARKYTHETGQQREEKLAAKRRFKQAFLLLVNSLLLLQLPKKKGPRQRDILLRMQEELTRRAQGCKRTDDERAQDNPEASLAKFVALFQNSGDACKFIHERIRNS